jgi:chromosome segregation ATPase
MLSKEQLQDAASCKGRWCTSCKIVDEDYAYQVECLEKVSKTALELMEENERLKQELTSLKKCYSVTNASWRDLAEENTRLKQEIEISKEAEIALHGANLHLKQEVDRLRAILLVKRG